MFQSFLASGMLFPLKLQWTSRLTSHLGSSCNVSYFCDHITYLIRLKHHICALRSPGLDPIHLRPILNDIHPLPLSFPFPLLRNALLFFMRSSLANKTVTMMATSQWEWSCECQGETFKTRRGIDICQKYVFPTYIFFVFLCHSIT